MPSVKAPSVWSRLAGDSVATVVGFALTCAVLLAGVWATDRNTRRLAEVNRELDQTHRVVTGLERLLSTLKDAETGQRGFVLTGDPAFLRPYDEAIDQFGGEFDEVLRLTAGDPVQQARLAAVRPRIDAKLALLKENIALRRTDFEAARAVVRGGRGQVEMDAVRATVAEMQADENRRIAERGDWAAAALRQSVAGELVTGGVGVVMVGAVFALVRRTDRVRAVAAEQKEVLRATLASIGDAVVTTDSAGNVTSLNAVAEALTGWTTADAAGLPLARVFRIVNESTRREVENPAARARAAGVVVGLANHTVLIAKDGTERPIDDSAAPIRGADGGVCGCVLVFRDVTDRKRAEAEARRTADLLLAVTDGTPDLVFAKDRDGRITFANPATLRAVGMTAAEFLGTTQADRPTAPGEAEAIMENDRRIMAAGVGEVVDEVYTGPAGTRVYEASKSPLRSAAGAVTGVIGVLRDVTALRRAEAGLKASEVRFRRLFESAKDGILILDAGAATIADANPFLSELLGYTREELLGKELWQIGLFKDAEANKEAVRELQDNRYIRYGNLPLETKAGRRINVEFVSNVYGEGDHAVMQCNVRDMTERNRLEDSLRRQAAGLSEADRRKNEFLATLAHELRNPLAPIRTGLQLVRLADGGGKLDRTLTMMERQLTQLVRLVDDLLDVSRITSGKLDLRPERVELRAVVAAAAEDARPLLEQAGHDLAVVLPAGPVYLDGDATRLAQVVANLLNNAAKYTPRGGHVRLTLGLGGGAAVVTVADDGIGIPAAMLGKVFDMFTQVDRALEKTTGGLGIGLSLVKGLVEMHGGTVEAHSGGHGRGSEFVVRLPAAATTGDAPAETTVGTTGVVPAAGRRVLVVDDNADAADSLGQLLELLGHEVRTAYDGEAGVEAARAFRPDVVVMDIGMPKLNGYEAARRIRGQAWGAGIVLVAQTGWGQDDDRRKSTDAGFDFHLVKPVDPAALFALLAGPKPVPA